MPSIRSLPLFADLTDEQYEILDGTLTEVHAAEGKKIASEGGVGQQFMVIADGEASVLVAGQEVARLAAGSFFGEVALIDHGFRNATIVAATPMRLLIANPGEFGRLTSEIPVLAERIKTAAEERRH